MGKFLLRVISGILPAIFFFKICSHIFMILESNWSSGFGHAETGNGASGFAA